MKPAALLTLLLCSATARHVGYSELSCEGRCGESYNPNDLCHCNSKCSRYNNCCEDYTLICGEPITDAETRSVSERLYLKDVNKPTASELQINPQRLIDNSQTDGQVDYSPERFYSYVNEEVLFSRPTYAAFISLLNNYQWMTGEDEEFTPEQIMEQDNFLTAIMETPIMEELYSFLHSKKKYKTVEEFKEDLKKMWFGLYSRAYGAQDSSGFEHIFLGEVKKGIVSGFHNWIQFYLAEKRGELNYYSHNFNNPMTGYPDILGMQFDWNGFFKEVGSEFVGSSPEFDFAIYTLCFIAKPDGVCRVRLGGTEVEIQTYTWSKTSYGNGKKYVASAYPRSP
eukprot:gi/632989955/ref/XP_007883924.1/ PREDICTED: poly(U)-specific endoribonuclease [Callorhinchus milii]